ncbi:MAG: glucose-1-phosphate cytidylyltransferase [Verrucomicrobia bacterium]|nr:glucose-1-phosphate cytidylyltransferase [Verrucomicrobiota bacterium]
MPKAVILCGGKGTRLREETEFRPKPMLPIGGRPILWHIMKIYAAHGVRHFVLCLGYKGDIIKDFFRNYLWQMSDVTLNLGRHPSVRFHSRHDEEDWRITLVDTGQETLTAGRIARIERYLDDDEEFFLTYGDGVGAMDITRALAFHRSHGAAATLTAVHPPGRFGELVLGGDDRVAQFNEKPQTEGGWINGGFFVLSRRVFARLGAAADETMFEHEPLRSLSRDGELRAFQHAGFWQPMDTYQEFQLLNRLWAEGNAPWKIWS